MGNNLLAPLLEAASRGVQVTIITNGSENAPPLSLKWSYQDHSYAPTATFRGAGYDLFVMDCDGDFSDWSLRRGIGRSRKNIIAKGSIGYNDSDYYHFDAAMLAAEAALREDVRKRIAILSATGGAK